MRLGDPYSFNGRSSRVAMNGQQATLGFENSLMAGRTNNNGNSLADFRPNGINLITNLDYPSESNRGYFYESILYLPICNFFIKPKNDVRIINYFFLMKRNLLDVLS